LVEEHVLDVANAIGAHARSRIAMPAGALMTSRSHGDGIAREAVHMEAHDAADVLAQVVATLAAGLAGPAGERAIHDHRIAGASADTPARRPSPRRRLCPTTSGSLRLTKAMPR